MSKKRTIKLNQVGENTFSRDTWHKVGPFKAQIGGDQSLTIKVMDQEPEILAPQEGQYGSYYVANFLNSKAFVDLYESKEYGTYLRIKLFDDVNLPAEAEASMRGPSKKGGAKKPAAKKEASSTENFWS